MLSELVVESFNAYIPKSHGSDHPQAARSQALTYGVKDGRVYYRTGRGWVSSYTLSAERVVKELPSSFALHSAAALVPIPASTEPPPVAGPHHSVSREIAEALIAAGMQCSVEDVLVRVASVPKASKGGPRDAHLHRNSLGIVEGAVPPAEPVVLVDDVATSGAQMFGAALRLLDAFPGMTDVRGFTLIRTVGEGEFTAIHDPVRRVARLSTNGGGACSFLPLGPS